MKNEPDVLKTLYLAKRTVLIDYAFRMLGSRDVAEEVVQEAFIKFVPALADKPAKSGSASYLFRIVHNLALDTLRRRKMEDSQKGHNAPSWTRPQAGPTPEEALLLREEVRRSMDMVAELPEGQRVALEMYRFGHCTLEQIAEHLDVSVSTAHRLVRRALATVALGLDRERS